MKKLFKYFQTYNGCNVLVLSFCMLFIVSLILMYDYGTEGENPYEYFWLGVLCVSALICFMGTGFSIGEFGRKGLIAPALFVVGLIISLFLIILVSSPAYDDHNPGNVWVNLLILIGNPIVAYFIASTFNSPIDVKNDSPKAH